MSTGTQTEVVMPQMGVSVSEGTVTKWLRQVGEPIGRDEPLLEISTDKVDTEVPSPAEGVVAEILVQEGETVEVGTVIARIAAPGADVAAPADEPAAPTAEPAPAAAEAEPVAAAQAEPVAAQAPATVESAPAPEPAPVSAAPVAQAAPAAATAPSVAGNGKTFVSPVVARIAAEHGIDASAVPGTGTGGRVTKKDILTFIESGAAAPTAPAEPAPAPATPEPVVQVPEPTPAPEPVAAAPSLHLQQARPLRRPPLRVRRPWHRPPRRLRRPPRRPSPCSQAAKRSSPCRPCAAA